jgi:hypothetical protein
MAVNFTCPRVFFVIRWACENFHVQEAQRAKVAELRTWLRWSLFMMQYAKEFGFTFPHEDHITSIPEPQKMNPTQKDEWVREHFPSHVQYAAHVYVTRTPDGRYEKTGVAVALPDYVQYDNSQPVCLQGQLFPCATRLEAEKCIWLALAHMIRFRLLYRSDPWKRRMFVAPKLFESITTGGSLPAHWTISMPSRFSIAMD